MTAALGLSDNVTFHGFVSDAQLAKLYRQAHVFLMPALQGYGLPAIEALYRRQGLILSEDSGVVEILGGTEWVAIARGSKSGFSQAMHTMLARVERPGFFDAPLPDLPSEAGWAQDLIRRCGW
jgi:glycosyltransferase involved in cell wall biosynthesis